MNPTPPPLPKALHHQKRVLRIVFLGVSVVVLLCVGAFVFYRLTLLRKIAEHLESIRKAGYPVTLLELNPWYPEVPPDENAAIIYTNAFAHFVQGNTNSSALPLFGRGKLPPRNAGLSVEMKLAIEDLLAKNQETLELLHEGAHRNKCRYPVDVTPGPETLLPHLVRLKASAQLLELEALMKAEAGDAAGAVRSIEDLWALANSLEQEPILISQLVRVAGHEMAISALERILNRHPIAADQLAKLCRILNVADNDLWLRRAWIGERCFGLAIFNMPTKKLHSMLHNDQSTPSGSIQSTGPVETMFEFLGFWLMRISGHLDRDELFFLETTDSYLRAVDVSFPNRLQTAEHINASVSGNSVYRKRERWPFIISGLLLTPPGKVFNKGAQHTAHLRSVIVGLALERHRASHNDRLPQRLQELVPELLTEVPLDPFDGNPLRYKRLPKGYVVYSVGPDGHDNDGQEKKTLSNLQKISGAEEPYDITFTVGR